MFFSFIRRYERLIYAMPVILFALLAIINYARQDVRASADAMSIDYVPSNYEIHVYHSPYSMNIRSTTQFRKTDSNIIGDLTEGTLFFISDDNNHGRQIYSNWNYPRSNFFAYEYKQLNVLHDGKRRQGYILNRFVEYVSKDEILTPNEIIHARNGLIGSSLPFIEWIRSELKSGGCEFSLPCKTGFFGYEGEGLYSTAVLRETTVYNRHGEEVGKVSKGDRVLFSMNVPPAVGYSDPTKVRTVGIVTGDRMATGTFFVDIFDGNGKYTIATKK